MRPTHQGCVGTVTVDFEDDVILGRVVDARDVISFVGSTPAEVKRAFEESVDADLALCAERGVEPDRPDSGKFQARIEPDLHRALATRAEASGVSLNALVNRRLVGILDAAGTDEGSVSMSIEVDNWPEPSPAVHPGSAIIRSGTSPRGWVVSHSSSLGFDPACETVPFLMRNLGLTG